MISPQQSLFIEEPASEEAEALPPVTRVCCPNCAHEFTPIYPERSALGGQQWVSKSAVIMTEVYKRETTILDYGCGLLRNTMFLAHHFEHVAGADTPQQIDRVRNLAGNIPLHKIDVKRPSQFDVVAIIAVLHILPGPDARRNAIENAKRWIKTGGELFVDVPVAQAYYMGKKAERFTKHIDGFVMKSGAFYRGFTHGQVKLMIEQSGLEILQWWHLPKHAIMRCRKQRLQLPAP